MSHSSLPSPQRDPHRVDRCQLPPSIRKAFVICLRDGLFLHSYSGGISAVADLQKAKLFSAPPISAANVFHAEILTVLTNPDGSGVRRTLLDCAATGTPKRFAPGEVTDERKRKRRQEEPRRIDSWLQRLHRDHPWRFNLLAVGLALAIFLVVMLLKQFFEWLGR
jgi:hypothetical protein